MGPRIHFFTTPRPITCMDQVYKIPNAESDLIARFIHAGYSPLVDSNSPCKKDLVVNGIALLHGEEEFQTLEERFDPADIFILIYWEIDHGYKFLNEAVEYFDHFLIFGWVSTNLNTVSSREKCAPPDPQPFVEGTILEKVDFKTDNGQTIVATVQGGPNSERVNALIAKLRSFIIT